MEVAVTAVRPSCNDEMPHSCRHCALLASLPILYPLSTQDKGLRSVQGMGFVAPFSRAWTPTPNQPLGR